MTKEEREKYRQEINSRNLYIGTKELIERTLLLGFLERIDTLEAHILSLTGEFDRYAKSSVSKVAVASIDIVQAAKTAVAHPPKIRLHEHKWRMEMGGWSCGCGDFRTQQERPEMGE